MGNMAGKSVTPVCLRLVCAILLDEPIDPVCSFLGCARMPLLDAIDLTDFTLVNGKGIFRVLRPSEVDAP